MESSHCRQQWREAIWNNVWAVRCSEYCVFIVSLLCVYYEPIPIVWNSIPYYCFSVKYVIIFQVMHSSVARCYIRIRCKWFYAGNYLLFICSSVEFTLYPFSLDAPVVLCSAVCGVQCSEKVHVFLHWVITLFLFFMWCHFNQPPVVPACLAAVSDFALQCNLRNFH